MYKYILALFLISGTAFADRDSYTNITYNTISEEKSIASAIAAAQHNFDWNTDKWQGSVSYGQAGNTGATSIAFAKRVNDKFLINFSKSDDTFGAAVNWRFDG